MVLMVDDEEKEIKQNISAERIANTPNISPGAETQETLAEQIRERLDNLRAATNRFGEGVASGSARVVRE